MTERKADIEAIKEKLSSIGSSDDGRTGWDDLADLTEMAQYDIPALIHNLEAAEAEIKYQEGEHARLLGTAGDVISSFEKQLEKAEAEGKRFEDALGEAQRECLESDAELEKLEAEISALRLSRLLFVPGKPMYHELKAEVERLRGGIQKLIDECQACGGEGERSMVPGGMRKCMECLGLRELICPGIPIEHQIVCGECGATFDARNLSDVMYHEVHEPIEAPKWSHSEKVERSILLGKTEPKPSPNRRDHGS
ncbi:hypothetical protein LCGC14_1544610 [marine sediment metagenome]|uniref:Uncharacterized protein n=1 Tax=marine sediment metagenome TaxID=412755 RepID=A0A0F9L851_9ZZZZ